MRNTKQRKLILNNLPQGELFTAKDLHNKLINEVDLATVYRNLSVLVREGMLREVLIDRDEIRYELSEDDHQHAVCSSCGRVYHFDINKQKILKALSLPEFEIEGLELKLTGRCKHKDKSPNN